MKEFQTATVILIAILNAGCTVVGIRTVEQAKYDVVLSEGAFEVRDYKDAVIAETVVDEPYERAGNAGFRRIAGYIFGKNRQKQKIAMTAPVIQENVGEKIAMTAPVVREGTEKGWRMAFVMPAEYELETLPEPNDPRVVLKKAPGKRIATVRYRGTMTSESIQEYGDKLTEWIKEKKMRAVSSPRSAGYDPPWTVPALRRNEVHIEIERDESIALAFDGTAH
jgi:hypothetical protein